MNAIGFYRLASGKASPCLAGLSKIARYGRSGLGGTPLRAFAFDVIIGMSSS